jgi:hypothetical protein
MINIEDRFGRPHVLRELIVAWHHDKERPVADIARAWDIDESRLRRWMEWYDIPELAHQEPKPVAQLRAVAQPQPVEDPDDAIPLPTDLSNVTLHSTTPAFISQKLHRLWDSTRSWDKVAEGMKCSRDELRTWAKKNLCSGAFSMISSDHLRRLINGEPSQPAAPAKVREST